MSAKVFYIIFIGMISGCTLINEPETYNYDTRKILDLTCSTIKDNYPYLSFKHINIDSLHSFYSNRLSNYKGDRVYNLLYDLLYELKDGHVTLYTNGGFPIIPYIPKRFLKDRYSYDPVIARNYFKEPLKLAAENKIEYGILENNIGYVYISTMGIGNRDWILSFTYVISKLIGTKGLILDVRDNGGGSDVITEFIVSHFLIEPIESLIWVDSHGKESERHLLNPRNSNTYFNKVIILQNGLCFSATEGFINVMRELPNVITLGDTTGGGSGNPKNYEITDNLTIRLSTYMQLTYQRKQIEWNGIEPDILIGQTKEDLEKGRDLQLEAAIKYLKLN